MGYPAPATFPTLLAQAGNALVPTRLQTKLMLLPEPAKVFANVLAAPVFRFVINVPFEKFGEVGLPNAAAKIGKGASPVMPRLANVLPRPAARFTARLFCASLNSFRNPFSIMFTSLRLYPSHWCSDKFPTYRTSIALFDPSER